MAFKFTNRLQSIDKSIIGVFLFILLSTPLFMNQFASAHSGRTDSSGGHNCNVGSCAGTYHYHNGGSYTPPPRQPVITSKTTYETEIIPFQTTQQNDASLLVGKSNVTQEGVNGLKTHTYKITYSDGTQTNKELVSSKITTNPVNKVLAIGTKAETPIAIANPSTPTVAGASLTSIPESNESASTGETVGGLAILGSMSYGVFRLGRLGYSKLKRD